MTSAAPPLRLGQYDVLETIATGGMARIDVGRTRGKGPRRLVALKVVKDELVQDPRYLDMFRDEAKILSRLAHPNIVETIEAKIDDDGRAFIAMELILGRAIADVTDLCAKRGVQMPLDISAHVCARVADALDYAHRLTDEDGSRLDVIHRDANPTNILVTYDGRVKLIDFGLAKAHRRRSKSSEGIVKGKVPYLSPEQIKQRVVDHRSDVYTLGATLWELTTGRRLWKRETDVATVLAIKDGKVPDPTELVPGYPEELWAIVWEALLPHRDDRYDSAGTMARDLDAFVKRISPEANMQERLAAFVEEVFPGERATREAWAERLLAQP